MILTIKDYKDTVFNCIDKKGKIFKLHHFTESSFKLGDKVKITNPLIWSDNVSIIVDNETKITKL